MPADKPILVYAYGNPGRQDDGLANRLIEELHRWLVGEGIGYIELESNYQLNIEDADNISDRETVIFVDASIEDIEDIHFSEVEPSEGRSEFTMHAASPAFILALCQKLYQRYPKTYLLQIRGYEWAFKEGLSAGAEKNLAVALAFMKKLIGSTDRIGFTSEVDRIS